MVGKFVSYLRVSTQRQGRSGLGLEAQREAVTGYLNGGKWSLVAEFVEVESGKRSDRPALTAALKKARLHRVPLVVAKVDRLTRSLSFLTRLLDSGVDVRFCDLPKIEGPTTDPRADTQYIVTEYGVADLTGKSTGERAAALIAVEANLQKCADGDHVVVAPDDVGVINVVDWMRLHA